MVPRAEICRVELSYGELTALARVADFYSSLTGTVVVTAVVEYRGNRGESRNAIYATERLVHKNIPSPVSQGRLPGLYGHVYYQVVTHFLSVKY